MKLLVLACIPFLKVALCENTSSEEETSTTLAPPEETPAQLAVAEENASNGSSNTTAVILPKYRPKYTRVADVIETIWQRPPEGVVLMGVVMMAHACDRQATDFWTEYLEDGSVFEGCQASYSGKCLGLPEERLFVKSARERGYLVIAIGAGSGPKACWDKRTDPGRVRRAINWVLKEERLRKETPVFAAGAGTGGGFLADVVESGLVKNLVCMASICGSIDLPRKIRMVPGVFVHMIEDKASDIEKNVRGLRGNGVPSKLLTAKPRKVNHELLNRTMTNDEATNVIQALRDGEIIDGFGYLKGDPKATYWQYKVMKVYPTPPNTDTLREGESGLYELLNVAYAKKEFTSQYTHEILDFCEQVTEDAEAAKQEL